MISVSAPNDFTAWRCLARELLNSRTPPNVIMWESALQPLLFSANNSFKRERKNIKLEVRVPKKYLCIARIASHHRDERKWDALYRVLWRMANGERDLLGKRADPETANLLSMAQSVRHDVHKMKGFVRFKEIRLDNTSRFLAFYRPDHFSLPLVAPFFAERFAGNIWAILTPDQSVRCDEAKLTYGPGVGIGKLDIEDCTEELWLTYYAATFNPKRKKPKTMKCHMPIKRWAELPEAVVIPKLLQQKY